MARPDRERCVHGMALASQQKTGKKNSKVADESARNFSAGLD
jgi:hypothetical protein